MQQKIGEMEILIAAARGLLYGLAEKWDRDEAVQDQLSQEVAITKYTVCNHAVKIVELAMSIAGGHSLSKDLPLERYFRDVQCGLYNPPLNDMVVSAVATAAIKGYRDTKQVPQLN